MFRGPIRGAGSGGPARGARSGGPARGAGSGGPTREAGSGGPTKGGERGWEACQEGTRGGGGLGIGNQNSPVWYQRSGQYKVCKHASGACSINPGL